MYEVLDYDSQESLFKGTEQECRVWIAKNNVQGWYLVKCA